MLTSMGFPGLASSIQYQCNQTCVSDVRGASQYAKLYMAVGCEHIRYPEVRTSASETVVDGIFAHTGQVF